MKLYNTNNLKEEHSGVQNKFLKIESESKNRRLKQKGQKIKLNKHLKVEQKNKEIEIEKKRLERKINPMSPDSHII